MCAGRLQPVAGQPGHEAPGQGAMASAINEALILTGFFVTSSGAKHGLIVRPFWLS